MAQLILKEKVIALCEHIDIAVFIDVYIKYLRKQGINLPAIRVINFQGVKNLPKSLEIIAEAKGFEDLEKVILLADANVKRRDTEHELYKAKQHSFLRDFAYDQYLFPYKTKAGNFQPGFLEDLLLPTLKETTSEECYYHNLYNIAREYLISVQNTRGGRQYDFVNYSRNFLYAYFAGTEKFVGLRLGEAAAKGAFDFEHENFKDLREFISKCE